MKIKDIRIGMKLRNPLAGRTGEVTKIEREGGLELVGNGLSWHEHVENVVPVSELHVGDRVRMIGPSASGGIEDIGGNGIIRAIRSSSRWCECVWDSGHINIMPPTSIEHVTKSFDDLFPDDELLIHPAIHIEDFRPLIEVAKCYIQVEPERLLLSQDARRVIEYLTAVDTPIAFYRIAEGLKDMVSGAAIIDGLIEAREAGIVRLDGGKYSIARD